MNPDARIHKLRQYVPFLKDRQELLRARGDLGESDKLKNLIGVITNKARDLSPSVLARCEAVCKDLYKNYGKGDDNIRTNAIHNIRSDPRPIPHDRVSGPTVLSSKDDQTPRSPSPEESNQQGFAPKSIPESRTDVDMRMMPLKNEAGPHSRQDMPPQHSYQREDTDYRHNWGHQSYQKRESRFDRYAPSNVEPPRWQDLNQSLPAPTQDRWGAPGRERSFTGERAPFPPSSFYRPRWQSNEPHHRPYHQNRWQRPENQRNWDHRGHDRFSRPQRPQSSSRREDPRLANRQKHSGPKEPLLPAPSPPQPQERAAAPKKPEKHHGKPPLPTPSRAASPQSKKEDPPPRKEPAVKPPEQVNQVPDVPQVPDVAETEEFVSPLGSLYTDSKPAQTGKGYGIQKYKIPKKNSSSKPADKPKEVKEQAKSQVEDFPVASAVPAISVTPEAPVVATVPAVVSAASTAPAVVPPAPAVVPAIVSAVPAVAPVSPAVVPAAPSVPVVVPATPAAPVPEVPVDRVNEKLDQVPGTSAIPQEEQKGPKDEIPLALVETILKKSLPSDDAEKLLERIKLKNPEPEDDDRLIIDTTVSSTSEVEPAGEELAKEEQAIEESTEEEPSKQEPAKQEPAKQEPAKQEPAKQEPAKEELAKQEESARQEPAEAEFAKAEPAIAEPAKAEPAQAEPAKAEPAREEPAKAEPAKEENSSNELEGTTAEEKAEIRRRGPTGRKKGSGELARLREDLTDLLKGPADLGVRRTRAKTNPEPPKVEEVKKPETRGRKRKNTFPHEVPPLAELPENTHVQETAITKSAEIQGTAVRKSAETADTSPEGLGKSKKRKKIFAPTRLSLRGKRSMYDNEEDPGNSDYFQCRECEYLGQKIVHHYVNEHASAEIPYVAVPESQWAKITDTPAAVPEELIVNKEVLSDLSWIPSRPNYVSPISCKLCNYGTCKRSELLEHVIIHAMPVTLEYRCSLCGLVEANYFDLLDHLADHTGEYRYRCNYCGYRISNRASMKSHMASLHEAQDLLFYSTEVPDSSKLWVFGFACTNCKYFQMSESNLKKHLTIHDECSEYVKFSMMSLVTVETRSGNSKEGVFVCPGLDGFTSQEDVSDNELTETLRVRSSSFIKNLAEKLQNPKKVSNQKENNATKAPPVAEAKKSVETQPVERSGKLEVQSRNEDNVPAQAQVDKKVIREEDKDNIEEKNEKNEMEDVLPKQQSTPVKCKDADMSIVSVADSSVIEINSTVNTTIELSVLAVDQIAETPKKAPVQVWKKNNWLENTISKLADKLGGVESDPLALIDQSVAAEEGDDAEEEGEEEESIDDEEVEEEESEDAESDATVELKHNKSREVADSSLAGFLKIESVMSLNDQDYVEILDPLDDVLVYSNVVLLRDEVTFPFTVEHSRPELVLKLKSPDAYNALTERSRLINFFKCLAFKCSFTCDSAHDFLKHVKWHSKMFLVPKTHGWQIPVHRMLPPDAGTRPTLTFPDFLLCSYCPFGARTAEELVSHIQSRHKDCCHQCSICVFRGWKPKAVALHILTAHRGMSAPVLACSKVKIEAEMHVDRLLSLKDAPPYKCLVSGCKFMCHHNQSLVAHFLQKHSDVQEFTCPDCSHVFEAGQDYQNVFAHLSRHSKGFYQCSLCHFGTDLSGDAVIHHCLRHPWLDGEMILRSADPIEGAKTMAVFGRPRHSQHFPIDFDYNYKELLYFVKVVESSLTCEDDVIEDDDDDVEVLEEFVREEPKKDEVAEVAKVVQAAPVPEVAEPVEKEQEFHGFGDEERNMAKKQTVCIDLDSDNEIEPAAAATAATKTRDPPPADHDSDEVQDGLFGRQLYMCGNIGCDETAETSAAFKDHLLMCDLARDSRLLTCRHCGKNMKHVANLMDHLRVHGIKRYHCGLCNYKSYLACQVRKHMKTNHKVSVVDEASLGYGPGPQTSDNMLHAFYPREMMAKLRLRSRSQRATKSKTFTCLDIANIPKKSIFSSNLRCAHCGYESKIRSNMIRHLSLHRSTESSAPSSENEEIVPKVIIPHQDPVNPVPLVENPSKGRMFDKMANLAGSSHELPAEREKATASQPVFVPDHQRYMCGFESCGHLTISESMLKIHLTTLHKNGVFSCPHCVKTKNDEPFTAEGYRLHLKMHGPRLYKCGHCLFFNWQLQEIDSHLAEKHPNRPPWQIIIREPDDKEVMRLQAGKAQEVKSTASWACSLCKFVSASLPDMQVHADAVHGVKSQYKCAVCPVRCNVRSEFERHFTNKHPNQEVQVLTLYYKKEDEESGKEAVKQDAASNEPPEPLWKKNGYRLRHIRGILLEENELKDADEAGPVAIPAFEDPVFGPYGAPSNGQLVCPKCNTYRVAYGRDMKVHLYKELDYKKYLCSVCNEGMTSRSICLKHIEKTHPTSGAFIREISYNAALENWVDQVIKHQTEALKTTKTPVGPKAKKATISPAPSAPSSAPSSPAKSPMKAKKPVVTAGPSQLLCLACRFPAETQAALEEHVASVHANDGGIICLECGFKALTTLAIANHQNRTRHAKTIESKSQAANVPEIKKEPVDAEMTSAQTAVAPPEFVEKKSPQKGDPSKRKVKGGTPYQCRHCKFSASSEHNMNVHWQAKHSAAKLPLEFDCSTPNAPVGRTLTYRCLYCSIKPGLYDDMHEHSRALHQDLPLKLYRGAAKTRASTEPLDSQDDEPPAKKQKDSDDEDEDEDLNTPIPLNSAVTISLSQSNKAKAAPYGSKESMPALTITPARSSELPALTPAPNAPVKSASPNKQTVFVVAPKQPQYSCVWCNAKFDLEAQVIRHHSTHSEKVPLRYTDTSKKDPVTGKPELIVMEIKFGCPVCLKTFASLALATQHVHEHKQAWKCAHCIKLFLTPVDSLQHMKDAHPGVQARLESVDSPKEVFERLCKGITLTRLHFKSPTGDAKELPGAAGKASTVPAPPRLTQAVAKKSTSNMFLKEAAKQKPGSSQQ